ncbi:OmpA family protein [Thiomicrorhabdus sediminis]|uniref:OmpA-like domain-containing protein n=1 Tax=Thiomicrorhabdus sediminis TaxID=2580412 RepID=A0A4P9K5R4_9GAMM|nr:OmpA family protein [Thiomicrorhabdus sediminis]QCU89606.1 hypothetical protein FE785_02625 [Thiomicrorhabdus sediminis]
MKSKLLVVAATVSALSLGACTNNPNKTAEEREQERDVITALAAIGGVMAANAAGVDNNVAKVAVGALAGYTARKVYGDVSRDTASDPNTDVSAVKIGNQEYVQVNVKNVNFRSGSATLDPSELQRLQPVLDALRRYPNTRVHIEGHTDSDGSNSFNQQLSENRAKNVAFYLMDNGIYRDRIVTYGYGEERPIADNSTADGKRLNRRVTFLISEI